MVSPEQGETQYPIPADTIEVNDAVIMRRLTQADAGRFHQFFVDNGAYLRDMMPPSGPPTPDQVNGMLTAFEAAHSLGRASIWGVFLRDSPADLHGNVQFSGRSGDVVELGYMRAENVPDRIRMSEAVSAVIRHGAEDLGIQRFRAQTAPDNVASRRLIERLGGVLDTSTETGSNLEQWEIRVND